MRFPSILRRDGFYLALVPLLALFLFSGSWHFRAMSGYSFDEPHVMGPSWEAAGRKELRLRCASNFAVGVSTCTSYSGVVDSLFLRAASALTGREIVLGDPELQDPLLQWLLILKRGVLIALLLNLCWWNLALATGNRPLALLAIVAYCLSPEMLSRGFEVSVNAEAGTAIFLIFTIFLRNTLQNTHSSGWEAILVGTLSTTRVPVALFSVLATRSVGSFLLLLTTYALWTLGLLRSSFEFAQVLYIFVLREGGGMALPEGVHTKLQLIFHNFQFATQQYLPLFPLALAGLMFLVRKRPSRWLFVYLAWAALIIYLGLSAVNSQPRYFIGFTGIFLSLVIVGVAQAAEVLSRCSLPHAMQFATTAFAMLVCALSARHILVPFALFNGAENFVTPLPFTPGEQKIHEAANKGQDLFIDRRVRISLVNPKWEPFRAHIHFFDAFNEVPQQAGLWVLPCFTSQQLARDFGLLGQEALKQELQRQCGEHRLTDNDIIMPYSQRTLVVSTFFLPGHTTAPIYELLKKSPLDLLHGHSVFPGSHPIFQPIPRIAFIESAKIGKALFPSIGPGQEMKTPAATWQPAGLYSQDWESQFVSRNGISPPGENGISLSRRINFLAKKIELEVDCKSNFREPGSELQIELDGKKLASCDLNTKEALFNEMPWARHFGSLVPTWKRKYYPCNCRVELPTPPGTSVLRVKLVSADDMGQVRFQTFRVKGL